MRCESASPEYMIHTSHGCFPPCQNDVLRQVESEWNSHWQARLIFSNCLRCFSLSRLCLRIGCPCSLNQVDRRLWLLLSSSGWPPLYLLSVLEVVFHPSVLPLCLLNPWGPKWSASVVHSCMQYTHMLASDDTNGVFSQEDMDLLTSWENGLDGNQIKQR